MYTINDSIKVHIKGKLVPCKVIGVNGDIISFKTISDPKRYWIGKRNSKDIIPSKRH